MAIYQKEKKTILPHFKVGVVYEKFFSLLYIHSFIHGGY